VPPGTNLIDVSWKPPALTDTWARRRRPGDRSATQ
jgi:hypothetical protein